MVGIHHDLAADVSGGPADHLDQRPGAAQETFLVGVENRDQRDLGQIDAFAQEIDADDDVIYAESQVAEYLDPFQRVDFRVEVLDLDAEFVQVIGQIFGHLLRQRRDDRTLALLHATADQLEQIVDLAFGRLDGYVWVDDAGRPDELLDDLLAALELVWPGRGAHVYRLVDAGLEFLERERAIVERRRQAEAEVDQDLLAGPVVLVHAHDLRDGHVALVHDEQPVRREVVQQRPGPRSRPRGRTGGGE